MVGKKGFFYVVIAIILVSAAIITLRVGDRGSHIKSASVIHTKIAGLNNLLSDIERDLARSVEITAFRSFLGIVQWETQQGQFVSSASDAFNTMFVNGTLNETSVDIMDNNTFVDWLGKIQLQAAQFNAQFSASVLNVVINQTNPWFIDVTATVEYTLRENGGAASWDRVEDIVAQVSIEGLEDPLYSLNTQGLLVNQIIQSNLSDYVAGTDTTNLGIHSNNSYYVSSHTAPSFLMRLEGSTNASIYGIESMINIDKLQLAGGTPKVGYQTVIDFMYFGDISGAGWSVTNMPVWFKLDNQTGPLNQNRHAFYEVEGLV